MSVLRPARCVFLILGAIGGAAAAIPLAWGQSALGNAAQTQIPAAPVAPGPVIKKPPHHPKPKAASPPVVQAQKSPHAQRANPKPAVTAPPPVQAAAPAPPPTTPERPADAPKGTQSGMVLPRFAALRSDEVNLRSGPGTRYPIEWLYHRRDLPVEIEREFEVWRLISDPDGVKGWVHSATLTGRRTFIVRGADATLRHAADDTATAVAVLKPGVVGRIRSCALNAAWCEVQVGDYRGFLKRDQFWGTYAAEAVN